MSAMSKINAFVRNIQGTLGNHQEKRTIDYVQRNTDNLSEEEIQEAKSKIMLLVISNAKNEHY